MDEKLSLLLLALVAVAVFVATWVFVVSPQSIYKSPEAICAEKGMLYNPSTQQCVVCSHVGQGCAFSSCCTGLTCNWDALAPLNLFRSCGGTQLYSGLPNNLGVCDSSGCHPVGGA